MQHALQFTLYNIIIMLIIKFYTIDIVFRFRYIYIYFFFC